MDLTHLERERDLEEVGQEAIEQRERSPDLVFPQERGGEPRFGDDVGEFAQADIDMDAGRVQDPSPLPPCAVWFDEEHFTSKLPRCRKILLGLLTAPLEILELVGKRIREVSAETCIADEGIDILLPRGVGRA